jgi:hypothetical protein
MVRTLSRHLFRAPSMCMPHSSSAPRSGCFLARFRVLHAVVPRARLPSSQFSARVSWHRSPSRHSLLLVSHACCHLRLLIAGQLSQEEAHLLQEVQEAHAALDLPVQAGQGVSVCSGCVLVSMPSSVAATMLDYRFARASFLLRRVEKKNFCTALTCILFRFFCHHFVLAGKRRYDRKQSGFGGQTKPVFRKKVRSCWGLPLFVRPVVCHRIALPPHAAHPLLAPDAACRIDDN